MTAIQTRIMFHSSVFVSRLQITQNVTHAENPKILLYPVIAVIPLNSPVIPQLGV